MTRQKPSLHSVFFTFVTRCLDAHWKARAASARDNTDQYGHSSKLISTVDFYYPFNIVLFNAVKPRGGCPGTPSHYTSHGASTNSPNEPRSARETMHTSYNVQSRHDTLLTEEVKISCRIAPAGSIYQERLLPDKWLLPDIRLPSIESMN
ncbi:hypothetical protein EDD17DRAFT_906948 [Pisolithus thermaeus]|nr:hypothetical protein EDD17DRAFT_906948 [Pisolithus thermaeus]